jgi:hypothetical protein
MVARAARPCPSPTSAPTPRSRAAPRAAPACIAPLIRVAEGAPCLHHGVASSLADLFDPARLRDDYTRGAHGPGSMSGHLPGIELAPGERDDLIAYLGTL